MQLCWSGQFFWAHVGPHKREHSPVNGRSTGGTFRAIYLVKISKFMRRRSTQFDLESFSSNFSSFQWESGSNGSFLGTFRAIYSLEISIFIGRLYVTTNILIYYFEQNFQVFHWNSSATGSSLRIFRAILFYSLKILKFIKRRCIKINSLIWSNF